MKTSLVTGITGQDGTYLAELLLEKGHRVIGTTRNVVSAKNNLPETLRNNVDLVVWDLLDQDVFADLLSQLEPDEIYNCAAYSSGEGMYDDPVNMGEINGLAVTRILESILGVDKTIKLCQASSREIFGVATVSPQNELTPTNPRSPYGAAKLYADSMVRLYREKYKLFACSAILYNHESPRRSIEFVTRKITYNAAKIKLGLVGSLKLGNLDARRDWSFAGDAVRAMWLMLNHHEATDYIIATGETYSVREFCHSAFACLDLDYRDYVIEDKHSYRPLEPSLLVGDIDRVKSFLSWTPICSFKELVIMMVKADLKAIEASSLSRLY